MLWMLGKGRARQGRGMVAAAARRGFALALDARALDRLQEASRAEASVCAALHAVRAGEDPDGRPAAERLLEQRAAARGAEARFVWQVALHALGECSQLPTLPDEALASRSGQWRGYRRRLRRLGCALAAGAALGSADRDLLSDAAALLDRMRSEGARGVGWPNAWLVSTRQREAIERELGCAPGGAGKDGGSKASGREKGGRL